MKIIAQLCVIITVSVLTAHAQVRVETLKGDVQVRHGAQAEWITVVKGGMLKPNDSIRSLKKSSATLILDDHNKLTIPEYTIVDISDLRQLTQHDLLLKLAMEDIKSVQPKSRQDMSIPRTTTTYGVDKDGVTEDLNIKRETMSLKLNGTKVLFDHGFFATCVLKAKEIYRLDPDLMMNIDARLVVASAFERMNLKNEALSEYTSIKNEQLNKKQRAFVEKQIDDLKQKEGK